MVSKKGHLDSRSSIRYVLLVTSMISLVYSFCQGSLEVFVHDENFHVTSTSNDKMLFGHGGVWFFCISSFIFTIVSVWKVVEKLFPTIFYEQCILLFCSFTRRLSFYHGRVCETGWLCQVSKTFLVVAIIIRDLMN